MSPQPHRLTRSNSKFCRAPFSALGPLLLLPGLLSLGCLISTGCKGPRYASEEYRERYDKELLSPGAQFAALPPAVQNTVRAETGSADIDKVEKDNLPGKVVYHIYFENAERYPALNVAADGSLLDQDLVVAKGAPLDTPNVITGGPVSNVTLNDLPSPVVKAIQRQAPAAELDSIIREGKADKTTYLINFKDHMHEPLRLAPDGTVL